MSIQLHKSKAVHNPRATALANAVMRSASRFYVRSETEDTTPVDPASVPFATTRYRGTLAADERFTMTNKEATNGFMFFFKGMNYGSGVHSVTQMGWIAAAIREANPSWKFPQMMTKAYAKANRDKINISIRDHATLPNYVGMTFVDRVNDEEDHFLIDYPVVALSPPAISVVVRAGYLDGITSVVDLNIADSVTDLTLQYWTGGKSGSIKMNPEMFADNSFFTPRTKDQFAKMGIAGESPSIFVRQVANLHILYARFKLSRTVAEKLTQTDFAEIRPNDLYSLMQSWARARMGANRSVNTPTRSRPLASIAATVPGDVVPVTNEDDVVLTGENRLLYLPRSLNSIGEFDTAAEDAIRQEDDPNFFMSYDPKSNSLRIPPRSMPLFVDWLNMKFSYTSDDGELVVLDLNRAVKPTAVHYRALYKHKLRDKLQRHILSICSAFLARAPMRPAGMETFHADEIPHGVDMVFEREGNEAGEYADCSWDDLFDALDLMVESNGGLKSYSTQSQAVASVAWVFNHAYDELVTKKNEAMWRALYALFSVNLVHTFVAYCTVFSKTADKRASISADAHTELVAYANQDNVDPDFEPEELPYLEDSPDGSEPDHERFVLPHQKRCMGKLSSSPNFAVLNVAAGGGKCLSGDAMINTHRGIMRLGEAFESYAGRASADEGFFYPKKDLYVLSADGAYQEVSALYTRRGDLWSVQFADGTVSKGLKEHKWYTQDGWKDFSELRPTDFVLKVDGCALPEKRSYHFSDHDYLGEAREIYRTIGRYADQCSSLESTTIPQVMSDDLAFVLGGLVSEGTGTTTFCNSCPEFLTAYAEAFTRTFGLRPKTVQYGDSVWLVGTPNVAIRNFLRHCLGGSKKTSAYQEIPRSILRSSTQHQKSFLRSLFEGDGYVPGVDGGKTVHTGRLSYGTISLKLRDQVFHLLKTLGFTPTLDTNAKKKSWVTTNGEVGVPTVHTAYTVSLSEREASAFSTAIGLVSERKGGFLAKASAEGAAARLTGQNSNMETQGWFTELPLEKEVAELILAFEDGLADVEMHWAVNSAKSVAPARFRRVLQEFADATGETYKYECVKRGDNRYNVRKLLEVVSADSRLQAILRGSASAAKLLERIEEVSSKTWCRVVDVQADVEKDAVVYDLCVPENRAYVANGYLTHNTTLCVTDILLNLKKGKIKRALILCPSHLVPQYVDEFNYFTAGRINVIGVNNYTLERHGLDGIERILQRCPPNTVVVADYHMTTGQKTQQVGYGNANTQYYPVVELLRGFSFDYVFMDESHFLRNAASEIARALTRLVTDIPMKRIASGTLTPNNVLNLVAQIALFDPSIFGTPAEFARNYLVGGEADSKPVIIPGKEKDIMAQLKSRTCYVTAKRKEWAACLPNIIETGYSVEMSPNQRRLYENILAEKLKEMVAAATSGNPDDVLLAKLFAKDDGETDAAEEEVVDAAADEANMEAMLSKSLGRLEQFMTAPGADILSESLPEEDRVSPKVEKIIELCQGHFNAGIPGKIIIFCNYIKSAEAIYENMGALKDNTILYTSGEKEKCVAIFTSDPNKTIMVGVEVSMNTGLNLQCFTGKTPVMTDRGTSVPIEDIFASDEITHVLSYNLEEKKIESRRIVSKIRTPIKAHDEFVSVSFVDEKTGKKGSLRVTEGHNFFVKEKRGHSEVAAGELKAGTRLITYGRSFEQMKLDADGQLIDRKTLRKTTCPKCSKHFRPGPGFNKHLYVEHGIDAEKYEAYRAVQSAHSSERILGMDEEGREAVALRQSVYMHQPEIKAKYARAQKARWEREGEKEQAAERMTAAWSDPEYKAKVGAAIAAAYWDLPVEEMLRRDKASADTQRANWADGAWAEMQCKKLAATWTPEKNKQHGVEGAARYAAKTEEEKEAFRRCLIDAFNTPEVKTKRSAATKKRHREQPGFTEAGIGAMLKAQGTLPNKPERNVIELCIPGLKYVGDGAYFVTLEMFGERKVKNPDFISTNHLNKKGRTTRVVEVIGAREYTKRDAAYDAELKAAYKRVGIDCTIVNAEDCYDDDHLEAVQSRIDSAVNNHYLRVTSVKKLTHSGSSYHDSDLGKYKYDIEVEGNHNYFAVGLKHGEVATAIPVLVHNSASRLIRSDSVWTPGSLEQGNARIIRPNVKAAEFRPNVYIDWVLVKNSIDTVKSAFLLTKRVAVEKLENADIQGYRDVAAPPLFKLSIDTIAASSENGDEYLKTYFDAYSKLEMARRADYAEYRANNTKDWTTTDVNLPDGRTVQVVQLAKHRIRRGPSLPYSKVLKRIPYVPGSTIYSPKELGLNRYDQFMRYTPEMLAELEASLNADKDEDDEGGDVKKHTMTAARNRDEFARLGGASVHTEYGDGWVLKVNKKNLRVQFTDGSKRNIHKLAAYVITRAQTSPGDIRDSIIRSLGDIPHDLPPLPVPEVKANDKIRIPKKVLVETVVPAEQTPTIKPKRVPIQKPVVPTNTEQAPTTKPPRVAPTRPLKEYGFNLHLVTVNDFVGLQFREVAENPDAVKFLQRVGFRKPQPMFAAEIHDAPHMLALFAYWQKKKFQIHPRYQAACVRMYTELAQRKGVEKHMIGMASAAKINNFFRLQNRPVEDANVLCPYPLVIDDTLYIALPNKAHPASARAVRLKVPGIQWASMGSDSVVQKFYYSLRAASEFLSKLFELPNVTLLNAAELAKQFTKRKVKSPKIMNGVRSPGAVRDKTIQAPIRNAEKPAEAPTAPSADLRNLKADELNMPEGTKEKIKAFIKAQDWTKIRDTQIYYRGRHPGISEYCRRVLKKYAPDMLATDSVGQEVLAPAIVPADEVPVAPAKRRTKVNAPQAPTEIRSLQKIPMRELLETLPDKAFDKLNAFIEASDWEKVVKTMRYYAARDPNLSEYARRILKKYAPEHLA